jgi:hypothetical protein
MSKGKESAKALMLTNKSTRVYDTSSGRFHPGTTKEFPEGEAIRLLGYAGEIVRVEDALGADVKKIIEDKDKRIAELEGLLEEAGK